jgi:glycosyltransferase involved in cell wall biosynthesis
VKLVSVICVCYNHERFVKDAIQSVLDQSYKNIELIVIDDGSTDNSVEVIKSMNVRLIDLKQNRGYCKAFNEAWKVCNGDFIIDLAADDELMPDRVQTGVKEFSKHNESYGVQFGDALYSNGLSHSKRFPNPPEGDVYLELIKRYFICTPSMMMRRSVITMLNGYDESLAYEDFDFWIRSSRLFKYFYTPDILVKKRIVKGSLSDKQFERGNIQQLSTYRVCEKILTLNKSKEEHQALIQRLRYELKQSLWRLDLNLAKRYFQLIRDTKLLIDKMHQPGGAN